MPVQPHVAPVSRWGDAVYQLALLIADDRDAAQQLTIDAFRRARQSDASQADSSLYQALLTAARSRRSGLALPRRRHLLPAAWTALPSFERAVLGLWLLRGLDGQRLAQLTQLAPEALLARLSNVLAPALDEPADTDFTAWLAAALGLAAGTPSYALDSTVHAARAARQQRLDRLTTTLRDSLANTHLPPGCAEAIEALDQAEAPGAWRRSPLWAAVLIGAALVLLVVVIAPWRGRATTTGASAGADSPTSLVQRALDSWALQPGETTRHLRVWAVESRFADRGRLLTNSPMFSTPQPYATDVWLDPAGGFRLEVTRDKQTVEWILADGQERLDYAVNAPASACEWVDVGIRGRSTQRFELPPEQQQELLQARLLLGAYGEGYRELQNALDAGDLRSYGRRVEGDTQLVALGYTAPDGRNMLLLFDAQTQRLRAVREVAAQGAQATARDLWRLEVDETTEVALPRGRPEWIKGRVTAQTALLDPTCPELRADHVVSLRALAGGNLWWGEPYVPRTLPAGIERMLLLSTTPVSADSTSPANIRLLMVGPDRWLSIAMGQSGIPSTNPRKVGVWDVTLVDDDGLMRASLCRLIVASNEASPQNNYCSPAFDLSATGFREAELLAVIEQLTPVRPDNWFELQKLFVDAAPLKPEVEQLLVRALAAATPPADGVVHTEVASESRVDPQRPVWQDPYHVPLDVLQPQQLRERHWLRYEGGTLVEQRSEYTMPDGTVVSANAADGSTRSSYYRAGSALRFEPHSPLFGPLDADPFGPALVLPLLESTEPITVSTVPEGILLRQHSPASLTNWRWTNWWMARPWVDDLTGSVERRVWLDPTGTQVLKSELVMIGEAGAETLLNRATLIRHDNVAAVPAGSLVDPAGLPADTLVYRREEPSQEVPDIRTLAGQDLGHPERVLVLPGVQTSVLKPYSDDVKLDQALSQSIEVIDQTGLFDVRRYRLPGVDRPLTVRQGSRDVLAFVLRARMASMFGSSSFFDGGNVAPITRSSEPVPITLGGQPVTAWLIQDSGSLVLVAELDGVLLTFSGPDAETLRGPVAQALAQMAWQTE